MTKKADAHAARDDLDATTIALIDAIAVKVRKSIEDGTLPAIELPVRNLANVRYDATKGYFELGETRKVRTLTVSTARAFAQTLQPRPPSCMRHVRCHSAPLANRG